MAAYNVTQNTKLIGGNQIKNSSLLDQQDQADQELVIFKDYSVLTEAHQIQRAFRLRFSDAALRPRPEYTAELLMQTMKI